MATGALTPTQKALTAEEAQQMRQKVGLILSEVETNIEAIQANRQHWSTEKRKAKLLECKVPIDSSFKMICQLKAYEKELTGGRQSDEFWRRSQLAEEEFQSMEETLLNESEDNGNNPYGSLTPAYIQLFKDIVEAEARVMLQHPQTKKNIALFTHYVVGCKQSFWVKEVKERHPSWNKQRIDKLSNTFMYQQNHSQVINDIVGILESVGVSADLVHVYEVLAGYRSTGKSHSDRWEKASPSQLALLASFHRKEYEGYFTE